MGATGLTFADTFLATSTLCFGEVLFLFRDLGLHPYWVSRAELKMLFDRMTAVCGLQGVEHAAHMDLTRFVEYLTQVCMLCQPVPPPSLLGCV